MPTLADLKVAVITDTNRDDLEDDLSARLTLAISQAIEYYQGERFWFNVGTDSVDTVGGDAELAMPATMRIVDSITLSGSKLYKYSLTDLIGSSASGEPSRYAEFGDGFYLWPTPSAVYPLTLFGVRYMAPPANDADTASVWTNQAFDLIAAHTKFILYRDVFNDDGQAAKAQGAIGEALSRLKQETARRNDTPLRMPESFPMANYSLEGPW